MSPRHFHKTLTTPAFNREVRHPESCDCNLNIGRGTRIANYINALIGRLVTKKDDSTK
jgi:hypothetical protein